MTTQMPNKKQIKFKNPILFFILFEQILGNEENDGGRVLMHVTDIVDEVDDEDAE